MLAKATEESRILAIETEELKIKNDLYFNMVKEKLISLYIPFII